MGPVLLAHLLDDNQARPRPLPMTEINRRAVIDSALAVKELDRIIAAHGERLESTKAAMASAISRFEKELELRESRVAELQELRKQFAKGIDKPGPDIRLQDVKGIGPVAEKRLHDSGINSLEALTKTPPKRIAEIIERNEETAKEFIAEAKRLLKKQ